MKTLCIEYLNNFIQFTQVRSDTRNTVDSLTKNLNKQTGLQHSTSHSVNDTHLKLVLCYDVPSQAFLFQFSSGLFLYIYQYVTVTYHSSFWYQSGFHLVCVFYFLSCYCIYFPCQTCSFHGWLLLQLRPKSCLSVRYETTSKLQKHCNTHFMFYYYFLKETKVWYLAYMRNKVLILLGTRRQLSLAIQEVLQVTQVWGLVYTTENIFKNWKYFFFTCHNRSSTFN